MKTPRDKQDARAKSDAHGCRSAAAPWWNAILACLPTLLFTGTASAANVLYFHDATGRADRMEQSLAESGHLVTHASGAEDFEAKLASGAYELGVLSVQTGAAHDYAQAISALAVFVSNGGKAIYSDWSGESALAQPFGATFTGRKNDSRITIRDSRLLGSPASATGTLRNTGWFTFSNGLAPSSGANVAAAFESGDAAIVFAKGGRSAVLGFQTDAPPTTQLCAGTIAALLPPATQYPAVQEVGVANVSTTSASLQALVNPNSAPTTVVFEYGAGERFSSVTPVQTIGGGTLPVEVVAPVAGLPSHAEIQFRARATNAAGATVSSAGVFTTNSAPVAADERVSARIGFPTQIAVLRNDVDPDGDPLSITEVTAPSRGTATADALGRIVYTPSAQFRGMDAFVYEISDGHGGAAIASVRVESIGEGFHGNYLCLLRDASGEAAGAVRLRVTPGGALSGTLLFGGERYGFAKRLEPEREVVVTRRRRDGSFFSLTLRFQWADGNPHVGGALVFSTGEGGGSFAEAQPVTYSRREPSPRAGQRFTVFLPADVEALPEKGYGWAAFSVSRAGWAKVRGRLPDGAPWTCSAMVSSEGTLPVFAFRRANEAAVAGELTFRDLPASDLDGEFRIRDVPDTVRAEGARFTAPITRALPLRFSPAPTWMLDLTFWSTSFRPSLTRVLRVEGNLHLTDAASLLAQPGLRVNARTGEVSGGFRWQPPQANQALRQLRLSGVVQQKANLVRGSFRSGADRGGFEMRPR